jgi:hypothetical protein
MRLATVVVLGAVAGLLAVALLLTLDARRMLLDTDAWTDSTAVVLEDDDARAALVGVVVDGMVERVTCRSTLAAIVVRSSVGERALARVSSEVDDVLRSDRATTLWRDANRSAHAAFVRAARTDRAVGDDRLLQVGGMLDRAATVTEIARVLTRGGDDAESSDDGCGSSGERLELLDPGAMRAAGDLARTLHDARWAPGVLAAAIAACLVLILLVARSVVRVGVGVVAAGLAAVAGAFAVRTGIEEHTGGLVDQIASPGVRDLARATIAAVLEPTSDHLRQLMVGGGIVALAGGVVLAVGAARRART